MISETTKFTRDSIETPILKTLELKSSEDIRLNEISFKETFFDETENISVDVVSILGNENFASRNPEMIHAFRVLCKDYFGKKISFITLKRKVGDNDTSATSFNNDVWMCAVCYDKNNNVVETFYSKEAKRQEVEQYDTTWTFEPFVIRTEYKHIDFRISLEEGNVNLNPDSHTMTMRSASVVIENNKKFYIEDWKTINQAKVTENFTTDFEMGLIKTFSSMVRHVKDDVIHLNDERLENINKVPDIETEVNNNKSEITNHTNNLSIHLSDIQSQKIEKIDGMVEKLFNTISSVENYPSSGSLNAFGVDISKKDLKPGSLSRISFRIPNITGINSTGEYRMAVQFFKEGDADSQEDNKSLEETHFSTNVMDITTSSTSYDFSFENLIIPSDVKFTRFVITQSVDVAPNPRISETVGKMRLNSHMYGDSSMGDSCILSLGGSAPNHFAVRNHGLAEFIATYDVIDGLKESEKTLFEHISDDEKHLSSSDIENIAKVSIIESKTASYDSHIGDDSKHVSAEQLEVLNIIKDKNLEDVISVTNDFLIEEKSVKTKSVNILDLTPEIKNSSTPEMIFAFSCDCENFRNDKIISVTLHKVEGDTNTDATSSQQEVWLFATCYGEDGTTIIDTHFSSNKAKQNANERDVTWYFDNFLILDSYKFIEYRITTVEGEAQREVQSHSNTNRIRSSSIINPDGIKIYIDGWSTREQNNNIASFTTDFSFTVESSLNFVQKTEDVLESTIDSLNNHIENSNYHLSQIDREKLFDTNTFFTNTKEGDVPDNYLCYGFTLGNIHIKPGILKKIYIPYTVNANFDPNNSGNESVKGEKVLAVQIYKYGEADDSSSVKSLEETYFSSNTYTFNVNNGDHRYEFEFDNLVIPTSFNYVKFIVCSSSDVAPNSFTLENCDKIRLKPIKRDNNWVSFDKDYCRVINGANNSLSHYMTYCEMEYEQMTKNISGSKLISKSWRVETDAPLKINDVINPEINNVLTAITDAYEGTYKLFTSTITEIDASSLSETSKTIVTIEIFFEEETDISRVLNAIGANLVSENYPKIYPYF